MVGKTAKTSWGGCKRCKKCNLKVAYIKYYLYLCTEFETIAMEFVRVISGYDHLWAVKDASKQVDELTDLLRKWNNPDYLFDFFLDNLDDLQEFFHVERISDAIEDTVDDAEQLQRLILEFPYTENLDEIFKPLGSSDMVITELTREKARNWERTNHPSWLRVYAIRLDSNVYVITGGAIKLTRTMQEREHTTIELAKLNECRQYLINNGVFDQDSFIGLMEED